MRIGVDTGGTFTDFVSQAADGRLTIHKQLSTPADPAQAILLGIDQLQVPDAAAVVHGSTVATNALLERRGARTALITTAGFGDVLAIGRQNRPDIYALSPRKPPPLVPRQWRYTVDERITAGGEILRPLSMTSVAKILKNLEEENIESVAVCLLFSFLVPGHERLIGEALQSSTALSAISLSLSSEILPEYREYERTATTVINAYVAPLMGRYLTRLVSGLGSRPLTIMQSNGGIISAETAAAQAARTALSGPAGGVVGARYVAHQAGFDHIITFDMGGTSTDVALCDARLPTTTTGEIASLPLRLPIVDIHTVGAGGGSIATVDVGGALHVGPESAGADPGPACYQAQTLTGPGAEPPAYQATVTDANLILGRLDKDHFLGGEMTLFAEGAAAVLNDLAAAMKVEQAVTAAWGVIQVANANMERAIRRISIERGHDPRLFTLVPFGGAGPLHACELAESMQIPRVLIPGVPGVLSALGMLVAAPTKDYSQTIMRSIAKDNDLEKDELREWFTPLKQRALSEMSGEGFQGAAVELSCFLDMRYQGQSHELTVPLDLNAAIIDMRAKFDDAHYSRYGYSQEAEPVEIVTIRLTAVAPVTPPELPVLAPGDGDIEQALLGEKEVWFTQESRLTPLYAREKLLPKMEFYGPALIFQYDTTIVVPPNWAGQIDQFGNLILAHQ